MKLNELISYSKFSSILPDVVNKIINNSSGYTFQDAEIAFTNKFYDEMKNEGILNNDYPEYIHTSFLKFPKWTNKFWELYRMVTNGISTHRYTPKKLVARHITSD